RAAVHAGAERVSVSRRVRPRVPRRGDAGAASAGRGAAVRTRGASRVRRRAASGGGEGVMRMTRDEARAAPRARRRWIAMLALAVAGCVGSRTARATPAPEDSAFAVGIMDTLAYYHPTHP